MLILLFFAFLAGVFTVLSPCILPILPALLSAGVTGEKKRPLGIVLGLVLSFTFFTLALTAIVRTTGLSPNVLRYAAIALLLLFGIILMVPRLSAFFAKITAKAADWGQKLQGTEKRSGFWSGIILGVALGLLWTPCAGPILAAITTIVATQAVTASAVLITLTYSLGAAIPMFLIMYGGNKIIRSSRFLSSHSEGIRQFFGGLMVLTAIAIAFHWDMIVQEKISSYIPPVLIENNPTVKKALENLQSKNVPMPSHLVQDRLGDYGQAPELMGIVNWINSPPLSLKELHGKVVLIDFWTYSCINCIRTLPYLKKWYSEYKDKGLEIIGVHTPEFEFEKDPKNVANAVERLGIAYPVAQDNDYKTWLAYHNNFWPAHYLIDQNGELRMVHYGEGDYEGTENAIRQLLGMKPIKIEEAAAAFQPQTPETYLGAQRGKSYTLENVIQPGQIITYHYQAPLSDDQVGLKGAWKVEDEKITSESDASYLDLNFLAKNVYIVFGGSKKQSIQIWLDGKPYGTIEFDGDRMYTAVETTYGRHLLSLKIPSGISAYVFTFGSQ